MPDKPEELVEAEQAYEHLIDWMLDNLQRPPEEFDAVIHALPSITRRYRRAMESAAAGGTGDEAAWYKLGSETVVKSTAAILAAISGYRVRKGIHPPDPDSD